MTTQPTVQSNAAPTAAPAGPPKVTVRYVTCLALLIGFFVTLQTLSQTLELYFRKEAVPLSKPLSQFDWARLRPNYEKHVKVPPLIDPETLESLGTNEYVNLRIVNRLVPRSDPTSVANVFITYYTGKPDLVPHVPEECYVAGGFDRIGPAEEVAASVKGAGAADDKIPLRVITFQSRGPMLASERGGGSGRLNVLYFFHCNGDYYTTRNGVRAALSSVWHRYAYYAKIEINFTNYNLTKLAGTEESIAAAELLLEKLMPVILEDHFGNWEKLATGQAVAEPAGERKRANGT